MKTRLEYVREVGDRALVVEQAILVGNAHIVESLVVRIVRERRHRISKRAC
jgi:hypothetical protein